MSLTDCPISCFGINILCPGSQHNRWVRLGGREVEDKGVGEGRGMGFAVGGGVGRGRGARGEARYRILCCCCYPWHQNTIDGAVYDIHSEFEK